MNQEVIVFSFSTMLSKAKCKSLWETALLVRKTDGEVWDIGCHTGGSSAVLKFAAPEKPVRMFDSFEGLPNASPHDKQNELGRFTARFDENLWMLGPVHQGWVPQTFAGLEDSRIAMAHIDLDLYQGTKDALEFVAPRLLPNGYIVVDDYGSDGWSGVTKAVDDFLNPEFVVAKKIEEQITLYRI